MACIEIIPVTRVFLPGRFMKLLAYIQVARIVRSLLIVIYIYMYIYYIYVYILYTCIYIIYVYIYIKYFTI
jgi:hypothetical protein